MDDKEILEKAIQKAIDGGWTGSAYDWLDAVASDSFDTLDARLFMFNHDFACALWGNSVIVSRLTFDGKHEIDVFDGGYKRHLQGMVIADNPIKYLGDNL